ncbi:hypothetical protein SESBI_31372 [Sesbania bispinosa]|nr:hypothetical protein SESBI_31372 [Sesbania bispinosa]
MAWLLQQRRRGGRQGGAVAETGAARRQADGGRRARRETGAAADGGRRRGERSEGGRAEADWEEEGVLNFSEWLLVKPFFLILKDDYELTLLGFREVCRWVVGEDIVTTAVRVGHGLACGTRCGAMIPAATNDFTFLIHVVLLTAVLLFQVAIYECGENGESGEGHERNSKSDSIKKNAFGSANNSIQLRKTKSELVRVPDESRNGDGGSEGGHEKNEIENGEKDPAGENCKDFDVCQEKVVVNEPDKKMVFSEPENRKVVNEPEPKKIVNEPEPKKVVSAHMRVHQRNERRPVSVPLAVKQSPSIIRNSTIYQNFSQSNSIPKAEEYHDQNRMRTRKLMT